MILYLIILTYYSCRMSRKLKSEGTHLNLFRREHHAVLQLICYSKQNNTIRTCSLCGFKDAEKRWKAPIFVKHL